MCIPITKDFHFVYVLASPQYSFLTKLLISTFKFGVYFVSLFFPNKYALYAQYTLTWHSIWVLLALLVITFIHIISDFSI